MQELKLINILGSIEGGSTKPLLINAMGEDKKPKLYVMKLFKEDYIEQNYSVAKEIFISELAHEFSLTTPNYGVIWIDHSLLNNFFSKEEIKLLDKGYKFCSEYVKQSTPLVNSLASLSFIKEYDIANLFCFDNLIINVDRGGYRNKSNLLINDEEFILIDHEQTIPFINNTSEDPNYYSYINSYPHEYHIASKYLRSLRLKEDLFTEFFESLKYLNIEKYNYLFDRLDVLGIQYGNREKIFAYLNWAKTNVNFLNTRINNIIK